MKRHIVLITIFLMFYSGLRAQIDTSFNRQEIQTIFNKRNTIGGYGAISFRYADINGRDAYISSGKGAWLINHSFGLGFAGCTFKSRSEIDNVLGNMKFRYTGGYGGILLEPVIGAKHLVHVNLPVIFGGGGIAYRKKVEDDEEYIEDRNVYFLAEPGIEIEANLLKFMRISLGAYYRFTTDVYLNYVDGQDIAPKYMLHGFSSGITFKFGKF